MRFIRGHHNYRLRSKIEIEDRGFATECWIIQQKVHPKKGYGRFRNKEGRWEQAHRIYYEKAKGPIPDGLTIDHLCCVKLCVNPDHLEAVTMGENNRRAHAKLTPDDVRQIRASGEIKRILAKRFGVCESVIKDVQRRRTWKDI